MSNLLSVLRIVAFLEGVSYILLLFFAVPMKHFYNDPQYVKLLGMPHGLLFIAYVVLVVWLSPDMNWSKKTFWIVLIASIIPFGTFYIDNKYLKQSHA